MRTVLVGLPILALAAILESTVLPDLALLHGRIDLVLLLTLSWTLSGDSQGGALWGFIGGIWLGLLSGGPLGLTSLALVAMAYLASLSEGRVWSSHVLLPLVTTLLASAGYHVIVAGVLSVTGTTVEWADFARQVLLPSVLLNAALILPVYAFVRWLHGLIYPEAVA
ncbi:MAG: rod shape-determining protein MreD [Anaerolineales bacterium]|nr:rod shape-determining protein MreD [Anaerolineales bacterium]